MVPVSRFLTAWDGTGQKTRLRAHCNSTFLNHRKIKISCTALNEELWRIGRGIVGWKKLSRSFDLCHEGKVAGSEVGRG
jgi:hypothetical protein